MSNNNNNNNGKPLSVWEDSDAYWRAYWKVNHVGDSKFYSVDEAAEHSVQQLLDAIRSRKVSLEVEHKGERKKSGIVQEYQEETSKPFAVPIVIYGP